MDKKSGFLIIGDPHVSSRIPGHRKDDYTETILGKLAFSLNHAKEKNLLPVILGDLFHYPRDNTNSVMGELISLFIHYPPVGVYGNHDVSQNEMTDEDSLSLLHKAGCFHLLDEDGPWIGSVEGQRTILGGTSWGQFLPEKVDPVELSGRTEFSDAVVIWITHHDLKVPTYEEQGHVPLNEIPGIDAVFNGHIHRKTEPVRSGSTSWFNLGNISRLTRSEFSKGHSPSIHELSFREGAREIREITVPHLSFDEVFHESNSLPPEEFGLSETVTLIEQLTARRTESGSGLADFIEANIGRFDEAVQQEILKLKDEVLKT